MRGIGFVGFAVFGMAGAGLVGAAAVSDARPAAVTTTTPTSSTTGPIPIPRWHLEGTHKGIEHFGLAAEGCAYLNHHLDSTIVMTSGSVWHLTAHYCGYIAHDLWSGAGTFTMSNTTGSTFSGTLAHSAHLPSKGVPYVLRITSGTGPVQGAHGSCVLSDDLVPGSVFGIQYQSGDLSCDVFG